MSFSNQNSLQITIQQLKEIVTNIQGEDHETFQLVHQMEVLVSEIERKSNHAGNKEGLAVGVLPTAAPVIA